MSVLCEAYKSQVWHQRFHPCLVSNLGLNIKAECLFLHQSSENVTYVAERVKKELKVIVYCSDWDTIMHL